MNPLLPSRFCVPDAEAHAFGDRMYIYGSFDIPGNSGYCSSQYHVFSSDNMVDWIDHGVSYHRDDAVLYAPDCVEKDGRYYLYYCTDRGEEGVAVSDRPEGPFTDYGMVEGANGTGIDPAAFVDDDGKSYFYWGQFRLKGGRLGEDMKSLVSDTCDYHMLDEFVHGFHEGSSMRRRGDWYYLVYTDITRGKATCLSYAMSRSPLGPFEKQGTIIDNIGCDPCSWNDHGSIGEYNGQWYVFYHRSSGRTNANPRVCAELIEFDADGRIREVQMTTQGTEPPICAGRVVEGYRYCYESGQAYYEFEDYSKTADTYPVCRVHGGDWLMYRYFNLPKGKYRLKAVFDAPQTPFRVLFSCGSYINQHVLASATVDRDNHEFDIPVALTSDMPSCGWPVYVSVNGESGETLGFRYFAFEENND